MTWLRASGQSFCSDGKLKRLRSHKCTCVSTMRMAWPSGCAVRNGPASAALDTSAAVVASAPCLRKSRRFIGDLLSKERARLFIKLPGSTWENPQETQKKLPEIGESLAAGPERRSSTIPVAGDRLLPAIVVGRIRRREARIAGLHHAAR